MRSQKTSDSFLPKVRKNVRNLYLALHPKKSLAEAIREEHWKDKVSGYLSDVWFSRLISPEEIEEAWRSFPEALFDGMDEFELYSKELYQSEVPKILHKAESELPHRYELYDANRTICERYFAYVRKYKPRVLVQTGVHNGVCTLVILEALRINGQGTLYSISDPEEEKPLRPVNFKDGVGYDYSGSTTVARGRPSSAEPGSYAVPPGKKIGWVVPDEYSSYWSHRTGKPGRELPLLLAELDQIDMFVHDSEHSLSTMFCEFKLAWEWLRPNGLIFSHHIGWNEAFSTFIQEHDCDFGLVMVTYRRDDRPRYSAPGCAGYIRKR